MEKNELVAAVVLERSRCTVALVNREGSLIWHQTLSLGGAVGDEVGSIIKDQIEEMLAHAALKYLQVEGIGISVPGISDQQRGTVWAPGIRGWEKYPLLQFLEEHLTRHDLPIRIESDSSCSLFGEHWLGIARGTTDAIYLSVGPEIGAGIMVDGRLIRGSRNMAGAAGWMALRPPFEAKFKSCGNFEYYASGDGLTRAAEETGTKLLSRLLPGGNTPGQDPDQLFSAYAMKDAVALKVIDRAIELWGMASANLISLFNPEILIFGGSVFGPGVKYIDRIYREAIKWAQPVAMRQVRFEASVLGENAPLLGAAHIIFHPV